MKYYVGLLAICFLLFSNQANARCYSSDQAEAEQGIRIHSELMVIGLNCNHMGKRAGQQLYATYREFTAKHANLFSTYEQIMMAFFSQQGGKNPEKMLNALRTKYANKISEDAASMRPDVFCARYAPRVVKAADMNHATLRKWAGTIYDSHPVSYPVCTSAM